MGTMKKKKKKRTAPKTALKRIQRLPKAKIWLETCSYNGKQLVHAYAKKFHTGLKVSITELRLLGMSISDEYEQAVKRSLAEQAEQKRIKKENKLHAHPDFIEQNDHFAYIVGYTAGGAPYGLTWDELDDEERQLYQKLN